MTSLVHIPESLLRREAQQYADAINVDDKAQAIIKNLLEEVERLDDHIIEIESEYSSEKEALEDELEEAESKTSELEDEIVELKKQIKELEKQSCQ